MSASTKRSGDSPSLGGVSVATRIAEIAAWLTRIVPAPSSSAASEASATTTPMTSVPVPRARTIRSATAIPTATPMTSSSARTVRRPRATPSEITAEIGAKNGVSLTRLASAHAADAATAVWATTQPDVCRRRTRRRRPERTSGSVGRRSATAGIALIVTSLYGGPRVHTARRP
jgi:hypothetical protein